MVCNVPIILQAVQKCLKQFVCTSGRFIGPTIYKISNHCFIELISVSLHCVFKIKFLKWTINFILFFQTLHVMWRKILAQLIRERGNVSKTFYAYEHKLQSGDVKKDKEKLLFLIFKSKPFAIEIINKHCVKRQDIKELWWNHWNWDSIDHYQKNSQLFKKKYQTSEKCRQSVSALLVRRVHRQKVKKIYFYLRTLHVTSTESSDGGISTFPKSETNDKQTTM